MIVPSLIYAWINKLQLIIGLTALLQIQFSSLVQLNRCDIDLSIVECLNVLNVFCNLSYLFGHGEIKNCCFIIVAQKVYIFDVVDVG